MGMQLDDAEVRVLGALMEKEVTTPEYYPLSLNALVNACNQKSNREPVVSYDEDTVETALDGSAGQGIGGAHQRPRYAGAQACAPLIGSDQPGPPGSRGAMRADAARTADCGRIARAHRAAVPVRRSGGRGCLPDAADGMGARTAGGEAAAAGGI